MIMGRFLSTEPPYIAPGPFPTQPLWAFPDDQFSRHDKAPPGNGGYHPSGWPIGRGVRLGRGNCRGLLSHTTAAITINEHCDPMWFTTCFCGLNERSRGFNPVFARRRKQR